MCKTIVVCIQSCVILLPLRWGDFFARGRTPGKITDGRTCISITEELPKFKQNVSFTVVCDPVAALVGFTTCCH